MDSVSRNHRSRFLALIRVCLPTLSGTELAGLRFRDIEFNRVVPDDSPHMRVNLSMRKGWTTKVRKGGAPDEVIHGMSYCFGFRFILSC